MKNKKKNVKLVNTEKKELLTKNAKRAYIALLAAVVIVSGSAFIRHSREAAKDIETAFDEKLWEDAIEDVSPDTFEETVVSDSVVTEEVQPIPETEDTADFQEETVMASAPATEPVVPAIGKIIREFSGDELIYSSSTGDFRTHNGIDIKGAEGDKVLAVMDGEVIRCEKDERYGIVVEIKHEDGLVSRYMGLQSESFIEKGKFVKKGDIIGGIGTPGAFEEEDGPHLHFEVQKDDNYMNPSLYF